MKRYAFVLIMILSILTGAVLLSCKRNHEHQDDGITVIKIDTKDNRIGNPINIRNITPLETHKGCLIGSIKNVVVWNNRIIVLDDRKSKAMFIFDEYGKLLFKTVIGKGPEEIITPTAFNIDRRDTTILLYQYMTRSFSRYDFNGNFMDSKTIARQNQLIITDFYPLGKDTMLIFHKPEL